MGGPGAHMPGTTPAFGSCVPEAEPGARKRLAERILVTGQTKARARCPRLASRSLATDGQLVRRLTVPAPIVISMRSTGPWPSSSKRALSRRPGAAGIDARQPSRNLHDRRRALRNDDRQRAQPGLDIDVGIPLERAAEIERVGPCPRAEVHRGEVGVGQVQQLNRRGAGLVAQAAHRGCIRGGEVDLDGGGTVRHIQVSQRQSAQVEAALVGAAGEAQPDRVGAQLQVPLIDDVVGPEVRDPVDVEVPLLDADVRAVDAHDRCEVLQVRPHRPRDQTFGARREPDLVGAEEQRHEGLLTRIGQGRDVDGGLGHGPRHDLDRWDADRAGQGRQQQGARNQ